MMEILNEGITKEEFLRNFKALTKQIIDIEKSMIIRVDRKAEITVRELDKLQRETKSFIENAKKDNDSSLSAIKRRALEQVQALFAKSGLKDRFIELEGRVDKTLEAKIKEINTVLSRLNDEKSLDREQIKKEIIELIPNRETAEDIRDKLELLEGEERLNISAINGLEEILDELKRRPAGINGGIVGRDIVDHIDISDDLDGSTKTFNIAAIWNIISVHTSSFPHALRPTIDYTWTPTSITFTDEIDAASTLASGQTVILTVVKG